MAPLLIVAPTQRCGTTLLQRLFNSTRHIIVYGENFVITEKIPRLLLGAHANSDVKTKNVRFALEKILSGEVDFDSSMLFPDYEGYLRVHEKNFRNFLAFYETCSKRYGFSRWGLKHQIRDLRAFLFFLRVVPEAQYVFIYRDLLNVARSARARWPEQYQTPGEFRRLGRQWQQNLDAILRFRGRHYLVLRYEDLIQDPDEKLRLLEDFTGIHDIDRTIMKSKINVSPILDQLSSEELRTTYRPPEELKEEEIEALLAEGRDLYDRLGYRSVAEGPPP